MDFFKQKIIDIIKKNTGLKEVNLEIPPNKDLGDYAFPCFSASKELGKNPVEFSKELVEKIKEDDIIEKTEAKGPYLNIFIKKSFLASHTIFSILNEGVRFEKKNKKILIESPGPNTNKPLHLGHARNIVLGVSLSNLLKKIGYTVVNVDIINDRGIHICRSMLAYQKFGRNKEPNKKPDHFVGDYYVLFAKHEKEFVQELQEMLRKWESGDKKVRSLWKKMNNWALRGIKETYNRLGVKIDKTYKESEYYQKGKEVVMEGLKKGVFEKTDDGSIIVDLEKEGLGKKVLIRKDMTSIYITQDLYLAVKRYNDYKFDRLIHVVGSEQEHHFKVLFKILEKLGYSFAKDLYHFSYGMIYLPEGKMKSREGSVVDADTLIDEVIKLAREEVKKRNRGMSDKELQKTSETIGLGALKFFMLKYDPKSDFVFNPKESISFEGETGPYVQYAHTRINSILKKYGRKVDSKKVALNLLTSEKEIDIIHLLSKFKETIEEAAAGYKPHIIARYLLDLSQSFNSFYHSCPILKEREDLKLARLALIKAVKEVLTQGLKLLGIETPERM